MKWQNLPPYLFYPLLAPYVVKLCIKYHAPLSIITKANPAFPFGGLPFAPKHKMFKLFRKILPFTLIKQELELRGKLKKSDNFIKNYPIILKPNLAHRGIDVHLIENRDQLKKILEFQQWDYLLQDYCDYNFEFGIFYCRKPGQTQGNIVSLTQKMIPILIGNGSDTLGQLIEHSVIENKEVIRERYPDRVDKVIPKGKKFKTLVAAAHSRGAIFTNAKRLITPELLSKTQEICNVDGFYFGRLDVKAKSIKDFKKGEFKIVEVNGATSEFTHIWDSSFTLKEGLRDLKNQWDLLFEIAHLNRQKIRGITFLNFCTSYLRLFFITKKVIGKPW